LPVTDGQKTLPCILLKSEVRLSPWIRLVRGDFFLLVANNVASGWSDNLRPRDFCFAWRVLLVRTAGSWVVLKSAHVPLPSLSSGSAKMAGKNARADARKAVLVFAAGDEANRVERRKARFRMERHRSDHDRCYSGAQDQVLNLAYQYFGVRAASPHFTRRSCCAAFRSCWVENAFEKNGCPRRWV